MLADRNIDNLRYVMFTTGLKIWTYNLSYFICIVQSYQGSNTSIRSDRFKSFFSFHKGSVSLEGQKLTNLIIFSFEFDNQMFLTCVLLKQRLYFLICYVNFFIVLQWECVDTLIALNFTYCVSKNTPDD